MLSRGLAITTVAVLVLLPAPGCGRTGSNQDNAAPGSESKADRAEPATTRAKPSGDDATIDQWVAMWQAVGKAGDEAGDDCDKAAATWAEIFKSNRAVFQGIMKLVAAQGEDQVTAKLASRIKEPMSRFTTLSKQCAQNQNMMEALHTMNEMYGSE